MTVAIVVLYYPDRHQLDRLLRSIVDQVSMVYLIDNTPASSPEAASIATEFGSRVSYVPLMDNLGIAAAQNLAIRRALDSGAANVILFDQDSTPTPGMVQALLSAQAALIDEGLPVAAVGPASVDERTGKAYPVVRYGYFGPQTIRVDLSESAAIEAHFLMASGCLMRASVLQAVGLMREDLFIDWVDNEWGLRARSMGLRCYVIPAAQMVHSVGDGAVRLFWRRIHLHSDARNYYLLRNAIYLMRVKSMGLRWKLSFLPRLPCYLVLYPLLSKAKVQNLRLVLRAMSDGLRGHMGRLRHSEGRV